MKYLFTLIAVLCVSTFAVAQKADVAFTIGGSFVSDAKTVGLTTIKTDNHLFYEGTLGVRMLNAEAVSLHLELPIAGIPSQSITVAGVPTALNQLSTLFITPALKIKILPIAPISPWASVGGGWARYSASNVTNNKGAVQYGGGIDFKTGLPLLGFRAEVRDFVTGDPNFGVTTSSTGLHHHNILAGGGLVLNF